MRTRAFALMLIAALWMCFTACGEESSSQGALDVLFPQGTGETASSMSEEEKADSQVMIEFKCVPNADSGAGQAATNYKVYYSGRATDEKNGTEKKITGDGFEKLKKYADDLINGRIETKYEGGDESIDTTVIAYTLDVGTPYGFSAVGKCSTDGFDEHYKIVADAFK